MLTKVGVLVEREAIGEDVRVGEVEVVLYYRCHECPV